MKPTISINVAISADGKITDRNSRPSGWTSGRDFERLIQLRRNVDALMVGRKTLLADSMTMRVPGQRKQPLRCVVSRKGEIPCSHPLWSQPAGPIHVLCTEQVTSETVDTTATYHRSSISGFLEALHETHGVRTLHCEGGGWLLRQLAELGVIQTIHCTIAGHTIFGGLTSGTLTGSPLADFLRGSERFQLSHFLRVENANECFLTYESL